MINKDKIATSSPLVHLVDKSFSEQKVSQYKLYVQISKSAISQLVLDVSTTTFIALKSYSLNDIYTDFALKEHIQHFINSDSWIKLNFLSCSIAIINNRSTLIPNAIFKKENIATYHQYNFSPLDNENYYFDAIFPIDAYSIYGIPAILISCFNELKIKNIIHFSSSLIIAALIEAKKNNAISTISVHVLPTSFQLIIIKNQQLTLYNSFDYQTSEDFIYYLLFVLEQQKIDNQKVTLNILGEIEKGSAIYSLLKTYVKNITLVSKKEFMADSPLKLSYVFDEINPTFYYSLFHQHLCE